MKIFPKFSPKSFSTFFMFAALCGLFEAQNAVAANACPVKVVGDRHTLVLLSDGTIIGWGNRDWGQIGAGVSGDFQPSPVTPTITGVKEIFAV